MPLKLNVGASRKITDDHFGSRGASINLEVELESALVSDSAKLQERIRQLFGMVHQSLAEELASGRNGQTQPSCSSGKQPASPNGLVNGGKQANGKQNGSTRLATTAQVKALYGIAKQHRMDLYAMVRERFNLDRPEELSVQQASDLITTFKAANA